jgi:hypothetical protein
MTSASSLAFPGSRTLATWWRQLSPWEPQALSVGYLFLHRLEAPAYWREPEPLDPLLVHVLEASVLDPSGPAARRNLFERLHQRLNLDVPVLQSLVRALADAHLIEVKSPFPEVAWALTEQGQEALKTKSVWKRRCKRGVFAFVEMLDPIGRRLAPPQFVKVLDAPASSWHVDETVAFDVAWLCECLERPSEWKKTFGFPLEVVDFPEPVPKAATSVPWDRVILDRAERLLVVCCQTSKPEEGLLTFGVRPEGWVLNAVEPVLRLSVASAVVAGEMEPSVDLDLWRHSWGTWCQMRNVSAAESDECLFSQERECLRIEAPERLIQRLQDGKSDVFKGETWLLAGAGYLRRAARLELVKKN